MIWTFTLVTRHEYSFVPVPQLLPPGDTDTIGSPRQVIAGSLSVFAGHPAYTTEALYADLHRVALLHGGNDGEEPFGEPTP